MTPAPLDLALYRGDTYAWAFKCWADTGRTEPADLTGVDAAAEIRDKPGGPTIMALLCTVDVPAATINVELPATLWESWGLKSGAWDLQLTYPGGQVATIVAGTVAITADVTDSTPIAFAANRLRSTA